MLQYNEICKDKNLAFIRIMSIKCYYIHLYLKRRVYNNMNKNKTKLQLTFSIQI